MFSGLVTKVKAGMGLTIRSVGYRFRRLKLSPFYSVTPYREEWCHFCYMDTEVETATGYRGGVQVARKRCRRCGKVIAYGVDRHAVIGSGRVINREVARFIRESGRDRR